MSRDLLERSPHRPSDELLTKVSLALETTSSIAVALKHDVRSAGADEMLQAEVSRMAAVMGLPVLTAIGTRDERDVRFAALHQLLLPTLGSLAQRRRGTPLDVAIGLAEGRAPRVGEIAEEVQSHLGGWTDGRVVVYIEDAQWIDRASAEILRALAAAGVVTVVAVVGDDHPDDAWRASTPIAELTEVRVTGRDSPLGRSTQRQPDGSGLSERLEALVQEARSTESSRERFHLLATTAFVQAKLVGAVSDAQRTLGEARRTGHDVGASLRASAAEALVIAEMGADAVAGFDRLSSAVEDAVQRRPGGSEGLADALTVLRRLADWTGDPNHRSMLARLMASAQQPYPVESDRPLLRPRAGSTDDELIADGRGLAESARHAQRLGATRLAAEARGEAALEMIAAGRWDDAAAVVREVSEVREPEIPHLTRGPLDVAAAVLAAARGKDEEAERFAALLSREGAARRAFGVADLAAIPRALTAAGRGHWEETYRQLAPHGPSSLLDVSGDVFPVAVLDFALAAIHTGRADIAVSTLDNQAMGQFEVRSPRHRMIADACRGLAESGPEGIARMQRALMYRDVQLWPFDHARVQLALAQLLRRNAEVLRARELLLAARGVFVRLDAAPWTERCDEELDAARGSAGRTDYMLTPSTQAWTSGEALTRRELAVVELAASGMSTREIASRLLLSERTVNGHLYRAYPKLGVGRRSDLEGALRRLKAGHDGEGREADARHTGTVLTTAG